MRDAVVGGPRTNGGTVTATSNKAPNVQTAPGFTIPVRTPFTLTATGTDANPADTLTYLWEQNDPGNGRTLGTEPGNLGPLFRVFGVAQRTDTGAVYNSTPKNATTTNPARDFPDVAQVMADNTDAVNACGSVATDAGNDCWSEYLPKVNRTIDFRVTARDGNPQAGGTGFADTALTVSAAAGPFRLTSQATDTDNGTAATLPVTWDVAGTDAAPINTANVRILLSTDDGASFPTVLAGLDAERRQRDGAAARGRPDHHGADPHRGRRQRLLRRLTRAAFLRPHQGAASVRAVAVAVARRVAARPPPRARRPRRPPRRSCPSRRPRRRAPRSA